MSTSGGQARPPARAIQDRRRAQPVSAIRPRAVLRAPSLRPRTAPRRRRGRSRWNGARRPQPRECRCPDQERASRGHAQQGARGPRWTAGAPPRPVGSRRRSRARLYLARRRRGPALEAWAAARGIGTTPSLRAAWERPGPSGPAHHRSPRDPARRGHEPQPDTIAAKGPRCRGASVPSRHVPPSLVPPPARPTSAGSSPWHDPWRARRPACPSTGSCA